MAVAIPPIKMRLSIISASRYEPGSWRGLLTPRRAARESAYRTAHSTTRRCRKKARKPPNPECQGKVETRISILPSRVSTGTHQDHVSGPDFLKIHHSERVLEVNVQEVISNSAKRKCGLDRSEERRVGKKRR